MTITWLVLVCEGIITFIIKSLIQSSENSVSEYSIPIIIIHVIFFIFLICSSKIDNKIKKIIIYSFFIRLILMIWDNIGRTIFALPDSPDTYTFSGTASRLYNQTGGGRGGIYSQFIAYIIYGLFGEQPLVAQYINILFSITMIVITYKTALLLNIKSNIIYKSILIMCFLPYLAIDDSLLLREAMIQMLLTFSIYLFFKWLIHNQTKNLIFAFIFTLFASSLHSGSIAMAVSFLIWILLYNKNNQTIKLSIRTIGTSIFILASFLLIYKLTGNTFLQKFDNTDNILDIVTVASSHAAGGAAYSIGTTANSIPALIAYTPLRMLYFYASPVPWMWRGVQDIISFLFSSTFYLYTIYLSVKTIMKTNSERTTFVILLSISVFIGAVVFAWGVSNAGVALRHRDKFIAVFILLYALCNEIYSNMLNYINNVKKS